MHETVGIEELHCTNLEEKEMIADFTLVKTEPTVDDMHNLTSNETICNSTEMHESNGIEELQCTKLEEKERIVDFTLAKTEPTVDDMHNLTSNETICNSTEMHESNGIEKLQCTKLEEKERIVDFTLAKTEPTVDDVNRADSTQKTSFVCDVCKKKFKSESHLVCHQVVHTAVQFYICSLCDRDVGSAEMYDVHLIKRHFLPKPFKCELCDKSFKLKRSLRLHKRSHVKELFHKCDKCNYQTHSKYQLRSHEVYHSNVKPYKCRSCDYSCFHLNKLNSHVKVHTGEKPYRCNICYKNFSHHAGLKRHKKGKAQVIISNSKNTKKMISCEFCTQVFACFKNLCKHLKKKHPELPIIKCCFCAYLTTEDLKFRKHKSQYHPNERLACEFCEFTSRHWRRIKKHHTRTHFTSNETICNSTQIHNSAGIEELKSTQLEEKEKFVADTEVKTEPNVGFSKSEEELNSVKESDKSILCDKSFAFKRNLTAHSRSHVKELFHKCDRCDYQTHLKCSMKTHKRIHLNMRPFILFHKFSV
ncbi:zinc finger protein 62-like [Physella acuta]|uniref:zinc finger protein 62-like n=1 Tax=Physella acuta TaxID=109671 RepID=UPI0027DB0055|nr:zinc finger protein 62-like [Physella acuta]